MQFGIWSQTPNELLIVLTAYKQGRPILTYKLPAQLIVYLLHKPLKPLGTC